VDMGRVHREAYTAAHRCIDYRLNVYFGMLVARNPSAGKVRLLVWCWAVAPAETESVTDAIGSHEEDESHLWSRRRRVGEIAMSTAL